MSSWKSDNALLPVYHKVDVSRFACGSGLRKYSFRPLTGFTGETPLRKTGKRSFCTYLCAVLNCLTFLTKAEQGLIQLSCLGEVGFFGLFLI